MSRENNFSPLITGYSLCSLKRSPTSVRERKTRAGLRQHSQFAIRDARPAVIRGNSFDPPARNGLDVSPPPPYLSERLLRRTLLRENSRDVRNGRVSSALVPARGATHIDEPEETKEGTRVGGERKEENPQRPILSV